MQLKAMGYICCKLCNSILQFIVLRLIATAMLDDSIVSAVQTLDLVFQVGKCLYQGHLIC